MKAWTLLVASLLASGVAAAQYDNNTTNEEPVGGNDDGWSPLVVLAVVIGLALLIGVIVAVMGRR